jgi:glyoxylase I family protein
MIQYTKVHHASLIVADANVALHFYRDILGMKVSPSRPNLPFPGAWLEIGTQQIHLLELPNPDPIKNRPEHGGRDRHIAINVNDIDELRYALEKAGVPFTFSRSGRRALFCRDPDGNALEFIENG